MSAYFKFFSDRNFSLQWHHFLLPCTKPIGCKAAACGCHHLSHVGAGLGGEVDEGGQEFVLGQAVHHLVLNVGTLACAGGTHKQDGSGNDGGTRLHKLVICMDLKPEETSLQTPAA